MDKFNKIISAAKKAALNERREAFFLKLSAQIYRKEQEIETIEADIKDVKHNLAVINFNFGQVNNGHPNYEAITEDNKVDNKHHNEVITKLEKDIESVKTGIAEIVKKQEDTVNGVIKMDYDLIIERANQLLAIRTEEDFKNLVVTE